MKRNKSTKQLIADLKQQINSLELDLRTQNCLLNKHIQELTKDLEVRKFKEKSKGEKYIVKMDTIPYGLKLEVSFLDKEEESVIQYYENIPQYIYRVIDHKVNENYVELYEENEIIMVYKITDIKLERVDLELYKKAYPFKELKNNLEKLSKGCKNHE